MKLQKHVSFSCFDTSKCQNIYDSHQIVDTCRCFVIYRHCYRNILWNTKLQKQILSNFTIIDVKIQTDSCQTGYFSNFNIGTTRKNLIDINF